MKNFFIFLIVLTSPSYVFAELEFFLSSGGETYNPVTWTSESFPTVGSDFLGVVFTPSVAPIPNEYVVVDSIVLELFETIVSQIQSTEVLTQETQQFGTELYETLISTQSPQFIEYITTSINPQTDITIEEKINQNIVLTPFEETFYNCNISLEERQAIVVDVLERLESGEIENLENITYSNPQFGDCIIPFPDFTHRETVIENSFTSNQLTAEIILGEEEKYNVHESIEKIIVGESEYQSSVIENEIYFSELLDQKFITPSQYKVSQNIQSYYQSIMSNTDISNKQYSFLVEEIKFINEMNVYFSGLLQQGLISKQEYDIFLQELSQGVELQKYFFALLKSGEISTEEYQQHILDGQEYLQSKKMIIESYQNNTIQKNEYIMQMKEIEKKFNERYVSFSDSFSSSYVPKTTQNIPYLQIILIVMILGIIGGVGTIFLLKKHKESPGEK